MPHENSSGEKRNLNLAGGGTIARLLECRYGI
jgi:hypothetical protein